MGKSAWAVVLEPIAGMEQAGPDEVKAGVHGVLRKEWRTDLDELGDGAASWIDYDEVYWVELDTDHKERPALLFWTYESVGWPMDLCDHWVDIALAMGRHSFDQTLGELGWRFAQPEDERPLPTIGRDVHRVGREPSKIVYFEHLGGVARLEGDQVVMKLTRDGKATDARIELASLSQERQDEIRELVKAGICRCRYCQDVRDNFGNYKRDVFHGTKVEPVHWWPSNAKFHWVTLDAKTWLCAIDDPQYAPYLYETHDGGERYRRVFLASPRDREARYRGLATASVAGASVGIVLAIVDKKPVLFRTRDGREWSKHVVDLENVHGLGTQGPASSLVAVWENRKASAKLLLSNDCGDTFEEVAAPGAFIHRVVPSSAALWAIYSRSHGGEHLVAVSFDRGATWTKVHDGFRAEDILLGRDAKTAVAIGTKLTVDGKEAGQIVTRTTDGGATWAVTRDMGNTHCHYSAFAHPDGRFYCAPLQMDGLLMSEDEGATWIQISDVEPTSMAVDWANEGGLLAAAYEKLHRVIPPPRGGGG